MSPSATGFGDAAGEHLRMRRGKYEAMFHVYLAYLLVACGIAVVLMLIAMLIIDPPGRPPWIPNRDTREHVALAAIGGCLVVGFTAAWWIFRDRWRCIEAFSSRYCSGIGQASLTYVPLIGAVYAVVRGARKLTGREKPPVQ